MEFRGNSSSLATRESGTARRSKEPARNRSSRCCSIPACVFCSAAARALLTRFGQHPGTLADAQHVEDQSHAAIAHDRRAGVHGEPLQLLAQGLDHDFLGVVDAVYDQAELPVFRLQYHHADRLGPLGRFEPQHLIQVGDGQQAPAPAIDRRSMHMLDVLFRGIALQADQLEQADLGDDEPFPSAGDHQTGNNGQSERDLELDRGAFTGPAEDIDDAADLLNVGLHHIHADAAS